MNLSGALLAVVEIAGPKPLFTAVKRDAVGSGKQAVFQPIGQHEHRSFGQSPGKAVKIGEGAVGDPFGSEIIPGGIGVGAQVSPGHDPALLLVAADEHFQGHLPAEKPQGVVDGDDLAAVFGHGAAAQGQIAAGLLSPDGAAMG